MHQQIQRREIHPGPLQRLQHPERLVLGGRGDLGEAHLARRLIQEQQIGERAAHVHARETVAHGLASMMAGRCTKAGGDSGAGVTGPGASSTCRRPG